VDVATLTPEKMRAFVTAITGSISSSPYSSAEMLQEYVQRGFPDLPEKVVRAIDQQVAHRQSLEKTVTQNQERRENRAQWGAQILSVLGLSGSLLAGYVGVPPAICIVAIVVSIGGPNAATIVARVLDRLRP
jgi:hypothetical protein